MDGTRTVYEQPPHGVRTRQRSGGSSLINGMCYIRGNALDLVTGHKNLVWRTGVISTACPTPQGRDSRCGRERLPRWRWPGSVITSKPGVNPLFEAMIEAACRQATHARTISTAISKKVLPDGSHRHAAWPSRQHRAWLSDQAKSRPNLTIRTHAMTDHTFLTANARWASSGWKATAPFDPRGGE